MNADNIISSSGTHTVWLCDLTHTQQTIASNTMPLAIGSIAAYAKKQLGDKIRVRLFKYPETLLQSLQSEVPDVLGFSNYGWNLNLGYAIAHTVKTLHPNICIVFGGPNYPIDPKQQEQFLRKRSSVDFYVYREGEIAFTDLLMCLIKSSMDIKAVQAVGVANCHYIRNNALHAYNKDVRVDARSLPSPYTTGVLDEFFDGKLMPLIQTNRGCPFSCTYCTESDPYFNKISSRDVASIKAELEYIAQRCKGYKNLFIADSNFGMYPQDIEVATAIADVQKRYGFPDYIHVATGKNNKERVLKAAEITKGAFRLSASVQSTDSGVLKNIKRNNVSLSTIIDIARTAAHIGSNTYAEIILGLPGDSKAAHFKSISDVLQADINYIRCFTLMILKGTDLDSPATREKYAFVTKYRVLPRCFGVYKYGSQSISAVEIEEVCVANNTLSFDDYLECRHFALTIELFYNDGILSELLSICKSYDVRPYDLLSTIHGRMSSFPESLRTLYAQFINETKTELFDSEDSLLSAVGDPQIIGRYTSGEYGSNLIFKYKALSFINSMSDIHDVAYSAARELIVAKRPQLELQIDEFLSELKSYSLFRKLNLLQTDVAYEKHFHYDFPSLEKKHFAGDSISTRIEPAVVLKFKHIDSQKAIIDSHVAEYGLSTIGIGRILSRIHVKKMYRNVSYMQ